MSRKHNPYGFRKRSGWPHPHNVCDICGEDIIKVRKVRNKNKFKNIVKDFEIEYGCEYNFYNESTNMDPT